MSLEDGGGDQDNKVIKKHKPKVSAVCIIFSVKIIMNLDILLPWIHYFLFSWVREKVKKKFFFYYNTNIMWYSNEFSIKNGGQIIIMSEN